MSADGRVVVGENLDLGGVQSAFRWESSTITPLPLPYAASASVAYGVSADGSVIVGSAIYDAFHRRAVRWFGCCAVELLVVPTPATDFSAEAAAIDADASRIVGNLFELLTSPLSLGAQLV